MDRLGTRVGGMRKFFRFWWGCVCDGVQGSTPFANDWQWAIGNPTVAAITPTILVWLAAMFGTGYMSTEHPILGPFAVALGAFVITWLMAAIIGAMRAAPRGYYHEKDRADELTARLAPKLRILFDPADQTCVHETFFGTNEAERVLYIAVVPIACTEATIAGCRGWLSGIRRLGPDNETWEATSFTNRYILEWGAIGFDPVDINPGMRQALNIVRIPLANDRIFPCVHAWLNKDTHIFDDRNEIFRFDISVVGQNCPIVTCSLRIQMGTVWNKPNVEEI
jgi:hypothetical protein